MASLSLLDLKVLALTRGADRLPWPLLHRLVASSVGNMRVAFCLHRVGKPRRPGELMPSLSVPEAVLDEFIEQMRKARPATKGDPWLTMAFDDGYQDAALYVKSRAERFFDVEWLLFVCPHKVRFRQAFRWDLYEKQQAQGHALPAQKEFIHELEPDYERELGRQDLCEAANDERYAIATREELLELASLHNVTLGNHTNTHLLDALPLDQAKRDLQESTALFEDMFGPCKQFAFPFGVPRVHFQPEHVEHLRSLGAPTIWTTEQLTYAPEQRKPGAVLPRVVFDGAWSAKTMALWVAMRARRTRTSTIAMNALTPCGVSCVLEQLATLA